jgi:hypothetical protein
VAKEVLEPPGVSIPLAARAYPAECRTSSSSAKLLVALKRNRHGHRDWPIGLLIYRHGLRVSEACDLRWDDLDLTKRTIIVRRLKGSPDSSHYLDRDELAGIKLLRRQQEADGLKTWASTKAGLTLSRRARWKRKRRVSRKVPLLRTRSWPARRRARSARGSGGSVTRGVSGLISRLATLNPKYGTTLSLPQRPCRPQGVDTTEGLSTIILTPTVSTRRATDRSANFRCALYNGAGRLDRRTPTVRRSCFTFTGCTTRSGEL